jgi:outer membrane protein OmpA-like peptidoglycan-associated protein
MRPISALVILPLALWTARAAADPSFSLHVEAAAAHPVGDTKSEQFGWGGTGVVAPEVAFHPVIGVEMAVGAMVLSDRVGGDPEGVAPTGVGVAGFSTIGPRVRPFATLASKTGPIDVDGVWIAGGAGAALTGAAVRPALRAAIGWDALSDDFAGGPFVGFVQMIEPDGGSVRPEDARVAIVGLHGAIAPATRRRAEPLDTDADGVADAVDVCPTDAEDRDGYQDDDGCPELDDDRDGVPDATDQCRRVAEDRDGFDDADGCPELDDDGDGVPDATDQCRLLAEDHDGVEDGDGCPESDADGDGIADAVDGCPAEPETANGILDADGCPDSADLHVDKDRIVLDDRVHFATNRADVSLKSWPLLARVAAFLNEHPEYVRIHVDGHADDVGDDAYNVELSRARALSVRDLLIRGGVESKRLVVEAFGEGRPRAPGNDAGARAENRRVELEILERSPTVRGEP